MYTVMDSPYRLPCQTVPSALAGAAQLRANGISICCYLVNVHITQPSVMTEIIRMTGRGWLSMLTAPWFYPMEKGTLKTPIPKCRLYWSFLFGVV
jgi:hypothetical protein